MARHVANVGVLRISSAGTDSPAISTLQRGKSGLRSALAIAISGPSALTGAVTVQVQNFSDATWRTLQQGGADVTIVALKTTVISPVAFADLRLHSASAEGADRDFPIDADVDMA